jgi:hypothetical protein
MSLLVEETSRSIASVLLVAVVVVVVALVGRAVVAAMETISGTVVVEDIVETFGE